MVSWPNNGTSTLVFYSVERCCALLLLSLRNIHSNLHFRKAALPFYCNHYSNSASNVWDRYFLSFCCSGCFGASTWMMSNCDLSVKGMRCEQFKQELNGEQKSSNISLYSCGDSSHVLFFCLFFRKISWQIRTVVPLERCTLHACLQNHRHVLYAINCALHLCM